MKTAILSVVASLALALGIYGSLIGGEPDACVSQEPILNAPYYEAEYWFGPGVSLYVGGLSTLPGMSPVMEDEALAPGDYYCTHPIGISIDGEPVSIHQYSIIHIVRDPSESVFRLSSTASTPRRPNWQPGSDRTWRCRVTCANGFMALCEHGLRAVCGCVRYSEPSPDEPPSDEPMPSRFKGVEYTSSSTCGIRR